jgi:hypothetical protein
VRSRSPNSLSVEQLREEYGFTRINLSGTMINEAAPPVRELG